MQIFPDCRCFYSALYRFHGNSLKSSCFSLSISLQAVVFDGEEQAFQSVMNGKASFTLYHNMLKRACKTCFYVLWSAAETRDIARCPQWRLQIFQNAGQTDSQVARSWIARRITVTGKRTRKFSLKYTQVAIETISVQIYPVTYGIIATTNVRQSICIDLNGVGKRWKTCFELLVIWA